MRDLFGQEVTMEQARALARRKPPTNRAALVSLRIERGVHPHNGFSLGPTGETCGSCAHAVAGPGGHSKRWWKCDLSASTRGPATDIRVRWPACSKWSAR